MSAQMTEARTSGTVRAHETSAMTAFATQPSSPACDHTVAPMLMSRNAPAAQRRIVKTVRAPCVFGIMVLGIIRVSKQSDAGLAANIALILHRENRTLSFVSSFFVSFVFAPKWRGK